MRCIVLTQPSLRAGPLRAALQARGVEVACWPASVLAEAPGVDWRGLARQLAGCRWVLLPSPGAIEIVMAALAREGEPWPDGPGIGLIGPGSRQALDGWRDRLTGLSGAAVVEPAGPPHDATALLAAAEFASPAGDRIAVLRRADGRQAWIETLRARGARVDAVTVYASRPLDPPDEARAWLAARAAGGRGFAVSVASADAGRRLARFVEPLACAGFTMAQPVLTQHPDIARSLRADGWQRVIEHPPGRDGLIAALESATDDER
jgi:uroporphyrinogen-III synthase